MRCIIITRPFAPDDPLDQDDAVHYPLPACGLQPPARRDLVSAARRTKKSKGLSLIGNAAATRTPPIGDCRCLCMPCRAKSPTAMPSLPSQGSEAPFFASMLGCRQMRFWGRWRPSLDAKPVQPRAKVGHGLKGNPPDIPASMPVFGNASVVPNGYGWPQCSRPWLCRTHPAQENGRREQLARQHSAWRYPSMILGWTTKWCFILR